MITLDRSELQIAGTVALMRQIENLEKRRRHAYGGEEEKSFDYHWHGCCGELAVAKFLDRYWNGNLGKLREADVGPLQVRHGHEDHYSLLLHPEDADEDDFALVVGHPPTVRIAGFLRAIDGKQKCWWKDPTKRDRWAFFVPQSVLRSPAELKKEAERW